MILVLCFAIIILIFGVIFIWGGFKSDDIVVCVFGIILSGVALIMFVTAIIDSSKENTPQAIDVYRGNTTLQITYQDSIPVDSVVVFKEK